VQEWHGARDIITKDRRSNRDGGRIRPGTKLQWEPEDYKRSGRAYGHARKAELDQTVLRRVTEYQKLALVEGSTLSEAEKDTVLE
jgi:hypothetical protein